MQNYYQLFEIANFASLEDVQRAFNKKYAGLFASESPLANIPRLKEMKDAFDILADPTKREEYDAALRKFLEILDQKYGEAVEALSGNNFSLAIDLLKECIRINPQDPDFYEALGLSYQLAGKDDEAVRCFQQGLQTNDKSPIFHRYLGDLFRRLHEDDIADTHFLDAAEGFKAILTVDPKNQRAQELLADTYAKMKWYEESLGVFRLLLNQFPYNSDYHRDIGGIYYELDMLQEAEEHLLEGLRIAPDDAPSILFLGLVYFKRRLLGLSVQTLEDCLRVNPNQPEVIQLVEQIIEVQKQIGKTVEEIIFDPHPDAMVEGIVKWYNPDSGLGVLTCDEYPEALLHYSALSEDLQDTLCKGDHVRYGVVRDDISPIAVLIELIAPEQLSDVLPGKILKLDGDRRLGVLQTMTGREIVFNFSAVQEKSLGELRIGGEVLFEIKTITGLSDEPVEQAINVRPRIKKYLKPKNTKI